MPLAHSKMPVFKFRKLFSALNCLGEAQSLPGQSNFAPAGLSYPNLASLGFPNHPSPSLREVYMHLRTDCRLELLLWRCTGSVPSPSVGFRCQNGKVYLLQADHRPTKTTEKTRDSSPKPFIKRERIGRFICHWVCGRNDKRLDPGKRTTVIPLRTRTFMHMYTICTCTRTYTHTYI